MGWQRQSRDFGALFAMDGCRAWAIWRIELLLWNINCSHFLVGVGAVVENRGPGEEKDDGAQNRASV
jgi:hypothetical protein